MNFAGKIVSASLRFLIRVYQYGIRPILPPSCRHYPGCSDYAIEAVTRHGPLAGSLLAARRLLRCHPWSEGGVDPVPDDWRAVFSESRRKGAKGPA